MIENSPGGPEALVATTAPVAEGERRTVLKRCGVCLTMHLRRRGQRACRSPAGIAYRSFLTQQLGLELLQGNALNSPIADR
jgi:hypothetical protein